MTQKVLFTEEAANGNGTPVNIDLPDDEAELVVYGTFDGATFTLESSPDNGTTWIQCRDLGGVVVSLTTNRIVPMNFVYGEYIRGVLSGGGGSMSLNAFIRSLGRSA